MIKCKSCGQEIEWITTTVGKKTPINKEKKLVWIYYTDVESWGCVWGQESHFTSCPNADKHRRKNEKLRGLHRSS